MVNFKVGDIVRVVFSEDSLLAKFKFGIGKIEYFDEDNDLRVTFFSKEIQDKRPNQLIPWCISLEYNKVTLYKPKLKKFLEEYRKENVNNL